MKAILVIDMPTDCIKCPLADGYCWNTFPTKGKVDGCPLRPLPQFEEEAVPYQVSETEVDCYQDPYATGWNDCLEAITGGLDESNIGD